MTRLDFLFLSTALNLFTVCLYRCLDFYLAPAWLFVSLLLSGIPLGAVVAQKVFPRSADLSERDEIRGIGRAVLTTIGVMAATIAVSLPLLFSYVRLLPEPTANSQSFILASCLFYGGTLLAEGILFIPFFVCFGMCEFVCYRYVLHTRPSQIRSFYVILLMGVVVAYVLARTLSPHLGVASLFVLSLAAAVAFWGKASNRPSAVLVCGAALSFMFVPGIDTVLLKTLGVTWEEPAVRTWGKYCHLTLFQSQGHTLGRYNARLAWVFPNEGVAPADYLQRDETAYWLIDPGKRVAVLGAGGGSQVKQAIKYQAREVVAVEMLGDLVALLKGKWSRLVDNVFNSPSVTTAQMEARHYLDQNEEPFDLIFMASTDSGFTHVKSMFEGQQRLMTREGVQRLKSRLTADGIIVVRQNGFLRYTRSILADAGLHVRAYVAQGEDPDADSLGSYYWLFATAKPYTDYPRHEQVHREFTLANYRVVAEMGQPQEIPQITDDKPFRGGVLVERVKPSWLVPVCFVAFLAICIGLAILGARLGPGSVEGNGRYLQLWAFMIGVNFLLVENFLVTALIPHLAVPMDAIFTGIIYFIALACVGSYAVDPGRDRLWSILAILGVVTAVVWSEAPIVWTLALMAPAVIWTGALFPTLLSLPEAENPLISIYVLDTVGALVGGVLTFGSQFLWGFTVFYIIVAVEVAALATLLLVRPFRARTSTPAQPIIQEPTTS